MGGGSSSLDQNTFVGSFSFEGLTEMLLGILYLPTVALHVNTRVYNVDSPQVYSCTEKASLATDLTLGQTG